MILPCICSPLQKFPISASASNFKIFLFLAGFFFFFFLKTLDQGLPPTARQLRSSSLPPAFPGWSVSASEQAAQTVRRQACDVTHS